MSEMKPKPEKLNIWSAEEKGWHIETLDRGRNKRSWWLNENNMMVPENEWDPCGRMWQAWKEFVPALLGRGWSIMFSPATDHYSGSYIYGSYLVGKSEVLIDGDYKMMPAVLETAYDITYEFVHLYPTIGKGYWKWHTLVCLIDRKAFHLSDMDSYYESPEKIQEVENITEKIKDLQDEGVRVG